MQVGNEELEQVLFADDTILHRIHTYTQTI